MSEQMGGCPAVRCGEYNQLRCVGRKGHAGEHIFVVAEANGNAPAAPPADDLVTRLRCVTMGCTMGDRDDAADEITALRAQVEQLTHEVDHWSNKYDRAWRIVAAADAMRQNCDASYHNPWGDDVMAYDAARAGEGKP